MCANGGLCRISIIFKNPPPGMFNDKIINNLLRTHILNLFFSVTWTEILPSTPPLSMRNAECVSMQIPCSWLWLPGMTDHKSYSYLNAFDPVFIRVWHQPIAPQGFLLALVRHDVVPMVRSVACPALQEGLVSHVDGQPWESESESILMLILSRFNVNVIFRVGNTAIF